LEGKFIVVIIALSSLLVIALSLISQNYIIPKINIEGKYLAFAENNSINVTVQGNKTNITTEKDQTGPNTYNLKVDDKSYPIKYNITGNGNNLTGISAELSQVSLLVNIISKSDGTLTIELPRILIDSKKQDDTDYLYQVIADDRDATFEEKANNSQARTLVIDFDKGTRDIEIAGSKMPLEKPVTTLVSDVTQALQKRDINAAQVHLNLLKQQIPSLVSPVVATNKTGTTTTPTAANGSMVAKARSYSFVTAWGSSGSGNGQFLAPTGIAVDPSGYVYISDSLAHRIQKFDKNGNFITAWGSYGPGNGQFDNPYSIAFDPSGYLYVADANNHRIQKFDKNGNFITALPASSPKSIPTTIAVDNSGHMFVGDSENALVEIYDTNGTFIQFIGSNERLAPFGYINPVAISSSGYVYVADSGNHHVQKFDKNGNFIKKWGSEGSKDGQFGIPTGIAVDSSGYVYLAETYTNDL
jgi:sugar lactone lactonase YvrE